MPIREREQLTLNLLNARRSLLKTGAVLVAGSIRGILEGLCSVLSPSSGRARFLVWLTPVLFVRTGFIALLYLSVVVCSIYNMLVIKFSLWDVKKNRQKKILTCTRFFKAHPAIDAVALIFLQYWYYTSTEEPIVVHGLISPEWRTSFQVVVYLRLVRRFPIKLKINKIKLGSKFYENKSKPPDSTSSERTAFVGTPLETASPLYKHSYSSPIHL